MKCTVVVAMAVMLAAAAAMAQDKKEESPKADAPTGATPTKINFNARRCASVAGQANARIKTEQLAAEYDDGSRWDALQSRLTQILRSCDLPDPPSNIATVVSFIAGETPYTVVVPSPQPYALTMLGKKEVRVVVLVNGEASVAVPSDFKFMSKRVDNPLIAAIPSVVRAITDAAGKGLLVQPPPSLVDAAPAPPPPLVACVTQVSVPFSRASISESGTVEVKVKTETKKVAVSATYANTPRSKVTFSTLAGGLVGSVKGAERMKVDSESYASAPLGRA